MEREICNVTIKDIADTAHVSITTVSRVLNDKPDVNPETRKKILEVIEELGYRPSGVARGLALKKTNVIGFLARDITNPNFPELARGIVDRAKQHEYSVMFFDTEHDIHMEKEAIRILKNKQVDGIILSFHEESLDELHKLHEQHFPVVQVYRESPECKISTVSLDNVGSAYTATRHLIELGHKRIGHLARAFEVLSGIERLEGYKKAMIDNGLEVREEWIRVGECSIESGYENMKALLDIEPKLTAVFASKDMIAIGAYEAIFEKGLAIPSDFSIVGHDNIDASMILRPRLTTMTTFKYKLGQTAMDLLLEEIADSERGRKDIVCQTELIVRSSTKALVET